MQWKQLLVFRLALAVCFGGVVAGMTLWAGWIRAQASPMMYGQEETSHTLASINDAIRDYRTRKHTLPRDLSQLTDLANSAGKISDAWGRPFIYRVQGDHYQVVSYGEDGKPGGTGLDTDLTSNDPRPKGAGLTFRQFLTRDATSETVVTACITAVLAGLVCFVLVRPAKITRQNAAPLILGLAAALAAATMIGMFITILHVPSGH